MITGKDRIIEQIDSALNDYTNLNNRSDATQPTFVITKMRSCIERFAPANSHFVKSMDEIVSRNAGSSWDVVFVPDPLAGVLRALKEAYEKDYLDNVAELIHADIFTDFVAMAEHLLSEGYKDPAAVIIGSVLEEQLRQLSVKNGIPTDFGGKPKKADQLNADLSGNNVYSKLDQKSVTGWLDLRNKAAHGKYGEYTKEQVSILITAIQDFMVRNPA